MDDEAVDAHPYVHGAGDVIEHLPDASPNAPAVDDDAEFWGEATGEHRPRRRRTVRSRLGDAWTNFLEMPVEGYLTLFIVAFCAGFTFWVLKPYLIFTDTTPAGGDMGAHVWAPAYLRDHLLPQGRLTGWTPDWYAGFPAFQFYMVVPSLVIALLSYVLPYGVAFKLVAVSGCVSMPISAYAFGRLARLPFPAPAILSCGVTLFLFDRSFSIYGGNIASTLAGEFAFSISLSLGLLFLGVLARGLETGRHRGWAALLFALTILCHLLPAIFVGVGAVVMLLLRPGRGQLKYMLTFVPVGLGLTAWWLLPFYGRHGYMNNMGWEKITRYVNYLWNRDKLDAQLSNVPDLRYVIAVAAVGLLLSIVYRRRAGIFLAIMVVIFGGGFVILGTATPPVLGDFLWNARLLPFYYLCLYLLAAVGVAELARLLAALVAPNVDHPLRAIPAIAACLAWLVVITMLSMSLRLMPGGRTDSDGSYRFGVGELSISTADRSFIDSWADWNFTGYEGYTLDAQGTPQYRKSYPEYRAVMQTMADVGRQSGCGRAMWEHEDQHDRYGTPMAMMLLPFWTDGCIGSMEGLYFEASATTPYHFLDQDELSWAPSSAQRELPYDGGPPSQEEFDLGVRHLQMLGVTYYLAINDNTKALAAGNRDLEQLTTSGPWTVYRVQDAPLVQGLTNRPAVLTGQPTTGRPWQDVAVCWWQSPEDFDVVLTADGPPDWQRVSRTNQPDADASPAGKCQPSADWKWFDGTGGPTASPQQPVNVTNVVETDDGISFDVDHTGVPVLVKTSYFPNWQATGADGPYRAVPNLMVVVPTANHVELHYGYTRLDYLAYALTILGIIGLVVLFRVAPVPVKPPGRFWGRAERPDLYPPRRWRAAPEPIPVLDVIGPGPPSWPPEPSTESPPESPPLDPTHAAALASIVPDLGPLPDLGESDPGEPADLGEPPDLGERAPGEPGHRAGGSGPVEAPPGDPGPDPIWRDDPDR